jgi:hypothetical protein
MATDMMTSLVNQFGGPVLEELGRKLGLPRDTVKAIIPTAISLVMAGLARVYKQPNGNQTMQGLLDSAGSDMSLSSGDFTGFLQNFDPAKSKDMLSTLAGSNSIDNITHNVAKKTGISDEAAGGLLAAVTPMVLGGLGKMSQEQGLDVDGLANKVGGELKEIGDLGDIDNVLDDTPGFVEDIQRGLKKLFG